MLLIIISITAATATACKQYRY
ncbi:Vmc-like lipoprotein signal peptide domain-containing protein [Acinetobacter sp. ANC 3813]